MTIAPEPRPSKRPAGLEWLPILVGILSLYAAPIYGLATTLWREDDYAHGPIILMVIVWLVWDKRQTLVDVRCQASPVLGGLLLCLGLSFYVLGQSQNITVLSIGSLIPVLGGTLLAMRGWRGIRSFWFALLFIIYLVPLPNAFISDITGPLKQYVSQVAEQILYLAEYPIARSGVTLTIGPYQLLVADACSGINSMFSLSAIGLLYLYAMQRRNWLHIAVILSSLIPIAFFSNVIRVVFLILLTYYFGDDAGQGFLHGFSGMLLFVVSLLLILSLDSVLARILRIPRSAP